MTMTPRSSFSLSTPPKKGGVLDDKSVVLKSGDGECLSYIYFLNCVAVWTLKDRPKQCRVKAPAVGMWKALGLDEGVVLQFQRDIQTLLKLFLL